MTMLTKIATGKRPEFFIFDYLTQEDDHFAEACQFCLDVDCNDDCVIPFPVNGVECDGCNGKGRIKFLMQPADKGETYYVITHCGFCDGIGLV